MSAAILRSVYKVKIKVDDGDDTVGHTNNHTHPPSQKTMRQFVPKV